ncbi:hypothetical protein W167_02249 [Staphylococcus aureus DAR3799]|nr:hypothetical protein W167_02249 [Staphylococcus aureus DAR3799]
MNTLYKTTLLITMAVVTWKVVKIERKTQDLNLEILIIQKLIMLRANHCWILLVTI